MGITKSESQTLIDAASKLKGISSASNASRELRRAQLSAERRHREPRRTPYVRAFSCVNTWHPAILTHSIPSVFAIL